MPWISKVFKDTVRVLQAGRPFGLLFRSGAFAISFSCSAFQYINPIPLPSDYLYFLIDINLLPPLGMCDLGPGAMVRETGTLPLNNQISKGQRTQMCSWWHQLVDPVKPGVESASPPTNFSKLLKFFWVPAFASTNGHDDTICLVGLLWRLSNKCIVPNTQKALTIISSLLIIISIGRRMFRLFLPSHSCSLFFSSPS